MKRVLVSGGSRGLGLSICRSLVESGYGVATVSRKLSPELAQLVKEFPGQVEPHLADLSNVEEISTLCRALRTADGFSGFVANAAIGTEGLLTLTSRSQIEECIRLNLVTVVLLTREVIKGMLTQGGSLVFISSISATRGFSGLSVYSATKGALVSFSRSLAREYGSRAIRSNCVLPGFLETEMTETLSAQDRQRIMNRTALRRLGQPQDIVSTVRFLLSEDAQFVTGSEFVIDGGLTA